MPHTNDRRDDLTSDAPRGPSEWRFDGPAIDDFGAGTLPPLPPIDEDDAAPGTTAPAVRAPGMRPRVARPPAPPPALPMRGDFSKVVEASDAELHRRPLMKRMPYGTWWLVVVLGVTGIAAGAFAVGSGGSGPAAADLVSLPQAPAPDAVPPPAVTVAHEDAPAGDVAPPAVAPAAAAPAIEAAPDLPPAPDLPTAHAPAVDPASPPAPVLAAAEPRRTTSSPPAARPAAPRGPWTVTDVRVADRKLVLATTGRAGRPKAFALRSPARLVVDLPGAQGTDAAAARVVRGHGVQRVRFGRQPGGLRIVADVDHKGQPSIADVAVHDGRVVVRWR
jgi:hypothetical protein